MIRHMSFTVADPARVASVLAELSGGFMVQAPSPPFPNGACFVGLGDDHGSMIELLPDGFVFDPRAPLGLARDNPPMRHGMHVLIDTPHTTEAIFAIATRAGWEAQDIDTGLFRIVKIWIDDSFPIEVLTRTEAARYEAALGGADRAAIDARLRLLEDALRPTLQALLPSETWQSMFADVAAAAD